MKGLDLPVLHRTILTVGSDLSKVPIWLATESGQEPVFLVSKLFYERSEVSRYRKFRLKITLDIHFLRICMLEKKLRKFLF